jgi:tetratricopeptide (TPR) repeat protein
MGISAQSYHGRSLKMDFNRRIEALKPLNEGKDLNATDIPGLEALLASTPDETSLRLKLLGFYLGSSGEQQRRKKLEQVVWFVQRHPEHPVHSLDLLSLGLSAQDSLVQHTLGLWEVKASENPNNSEVWGYAGNFISQFDLTRGLKCLEKAVELAPNQPHWPTRICLICWNKACYGEDEPLELCLEKVIFYGDLAMQMCLESKSSPSQELYRFAALAALFLGQYDNATKLALKHKERLSLAAKGHGQPFVDRISGLTALMKGDRTGAKQKLSFATDEKLNRWHTMLSDRNSRVLQEL